MTKDKEIEYVVRDYSAVDAQVDEIARREKEKTRQLQISNLTKLVFLGLYILAGIALLILVCGIAYRIAFPPKIEVIEKTEIIEKVVEPQPIIIQTPSGTSTSLKTPSNTESKIFGNDDIAKNIRASEEGKDEEKSVIGQRSVTTFTKIPSYIDGFASVTTGWTWNDINSKEPADEFCYVHKINSVGDTIRYDLAIKDNLNINKTNVNQIYSSGLTESQLETLISKCRWFTN